MQVLTAKDHKRNGQRRCPYCGSSRVRRSHRSGAMERFLLPLLLQRPFHCKSCLQRHYALSFGKKTLARVGLTLAVTLTVVGVSTAVVTGWLWTWVWTALQTILGVFGIR